LLNTQGESLAAHHVTNSHLQRAAATRGDVRLVQEQLINADFKDEHGRTPLSVAAECGHMEVVKLLLATNGVDPTSKDNCGQTPLSYAAEEGHVEVVKLLLDIPGVDPNEEDNDLRTPLTYAAIRGHADVVMCLASRIEDKESTKRYKEIATRI
jgi:ankyrin repeat protein